MENALKYSSSEKNIHVSLTEEDKYLRICISDEGHGIPDSEKKKIFDKFYRIGNENTRKAKGTGLGLYLTQKIMEDHQGSVFVTDNIPTGIKFVVLFPKKLA